MKSFFKNSPPILLLSCLLCAAQAQVKKEPVDYVNPYIGNISHLLVPTFPTVHLPNSMLRVIPERADFTSSYVSGLPVLLASHRGSTAFKLLPFIGNEKDIKPDLQYNYDLEKIQPHRYSVYLQDFDIDVSFAPARKSALYKFGSPANENKYLIIKASDGELEANSNVVWGYQNLEGGRAKAFIYLILEKKPEKAGIFEKGVASFGKSKAQGKNADVILSFGKSGNIPAIRYGVSFISVNQAKKNLEKEIKDFDLEKVASQGRSIWNQALGKIKVDGGSENEKTVFYTSLYRTYERMIDISEDGKYFSPQDKKVHDDKGVNYFTDDWIWDTYKATHALQGLINPQLETQKIASFIRAAEESKEGWMPTFPTITGDLHVMNGNHAVGVIWDAYVKGLRGFDLEKAYLHCKKSIMEETMAPWSRKKAGDLDEFYKEKGYYPALKPGEKETSNLVHGWEKRQTVAVTLAASYDDWCLAQIAKELGKQDDHSYFLNRSYNYRNLYNKETGFFHPKDSEGNFIVPFDYKFSGGIGARDYYDENNAYTYQWDVQHNIGDLVKLMGGPEQFNKNLDQLFAEPLGKSKWEFYSTLPDQTGNVGQFTMGNEPSLHIPYLYNYAGAPWKTQKRIRSLLEMWFRNDLMGIPGDEDGGGLTSFVVFSSMGFYPVTVGSPTYNIGSPLFSRVSVDLGAGKTFVVDAKNCSRDNKYIQSAKLNGKPWSKPWFNHSDIVNGGTLELVMGNKPNKFWGASAADVPPSAGEKN